METYNRVNRTTHPANEASYHLYEIDKLISRTIGYTVVAALLTGVFFR